MTNSFSRGWRDRYTKIRTFGWAGGKTVLSMYQKVEWEGDVRYYMKVDEMSKNDPSESAS